MQLTLAQLRRIATGPADVSNMQSVIAGLATYGAQAGLDKPWRLAMYVAQLAHESGDFRYDHELWGPTPAQAGYDTRADLGNTPAKDGDGKLYEGRTGIEVTGKANYAAFRDWCRQQGFNCPNFVANPEAIDTDPWEGLAPIWFWSTHGLNALADAGNFVGTTQRINGGQNGAADRLAFYIRTALVLLGFAPTDVKGFQKARNLVVDGDAGPATLAAFHLALQQVGDVPAPVAQPVAYIQPAPYVATLGDVKAELKANGSTTINTADLMTKVTVGAGATAGVAGAVSELTNSLAGVPHWVWWAAALGVAATILYLTNKIVRARVDTAVTGIQTEIGIVRPQGSPLAADPVPAEQPEPAADVAAAQPAPAAA